MYPASLPKTLRIQSSPAFLFQVHKSIFHTFLFIYDCVTAWEAVSTFFLKKDSLHLAIVIFTLSTVPFNLNFNEMKKDFISWTCRYEKFLMKHSSCFSFFASFLPSYFLLSELGFFSSCLLLSLFLSLLCYHFLTYHYIKKPRS